MAAIYAGVLAFVAQTGSWIAFAFCLGMILGAWLRDLAWLRATQRSWPFTARVTNWGLVETLATKLDSASVDGEEFV